MNKKNTMRILQNYLPYLFLLVAAAIIVASFFLREKYSSEMEQSLKKNAAYVTQQQQEAENESSYQPVGPVVKETPYTNESNYQSKKYESLSKNNVFALLVEKPVYVKPPPKPLPAPDLAYAVRSWKVMGPMYGIPSMDIPDKMSVEVAKDDFKDFAKGDKVYVKTRRHGELEIEIRSMDLKQFHITVGYYYEELDQDITHTLKMF